MVCTKITDAPSDHYPGLPDADLTLSTTHVIFSSELTRPYLQMIDHPDVKGFTFG